jgi:uncharacterized protein HemY
LNSALQIFASPAVTKSIEKKSKRRTKKRKRDNTLIEQLSSNREGEFRDAEREVKRVTVVEKSDFQAQINGGIEKLERRRSLRTR